MNLVRDRVSVFIHTNNMSKEGWAELPNDMLFLLATRIVGLANIFRFGTVCSYWRLIVQENMQLLLASDYNRVPWVMLPAAKNSDDIRKFFDLSTSEIYEFSLPQAQHSRCVGSAHGWLVMAGEDMKIHLLNPLTGLQIPLPPHPLYQMRRKLHPFDAITSNGVRDGFITKATLSSDPLTGDCIVMAKHLGPEFYSYSASFCRPTDQQWMTIGSRDYEREIEFLRLQFYSVSNFGGAFDTSKLFAYAGDLTQEPKMVEIVSLPHSYESCYGVWRGYIAECGGELIAVNRYWRQHCPPMTMVCKIMRVDLEAKKVIEVEGIGDYTLYLGLSNSICLPATSANDSCRRNCIYFTEDAFYHNMGEIEQDLVVYNCETKSFKAFYPGSLKGSFSPPAWFAPSL